jgi:hypothetical protein
MMHALRSVFIRTVAVLAVCLPLSLLFIPLCQRVLFAVALLRVPVVQVATPVAPAPPVVSVGGTSVVGGPSISAQMIDVVLARASSPAVGTGQALYDLSVQYHIDDAYALAVFQHESTFGLYGYGHDDKALGNIICAGYPTCNGRFRSYPSWAVGYEDFYRLLTREYLSHGLSTVESITPVYAPSSENDVSTYIRSVVAAMRAFRSLQAA